MGRTLRLMTVAAALLWPGCGGENRPALRADALTLSSPAFSDGGQIPKLYTATDKSLSPPLEWRNAPPGTHSFALVSDYLGRDLRHWQHWVAYNIPGTLTGLPEGAGSSGDSLGWDLAGGGYTGPSEDPMRTQRYRLTLYALDTVFDSSRLMVDEHTLRSAMAGHVLDSARLEFTHAQPGAVGHWWK
jgi:Raf kinase inhibitor-like YbhB/YbcL family protein